MPTSVALHHRTTYRYGGPVTVGPHIVRLRPAPFTRAVIRAYTLAVSPEPRSLRWFQDAPGNVVAQLLFQEPTDTLEFTVALQAELGEVNPFDFVLDPAAVTWPFSYPDPLTHELVAYRGVEPIRPWLAALLTDIAVKTQPSVELLVSLNRLLFEKIKYITRMEPGVLSPEETVSCGSGSCRDVAWLLVTVARSLGFAARFVSGYLIQLVDAEAPTLASRRTASTSMPGRKSTFPAPVGSASTPPPGSSPGPVTSRSPAARTMNPRPPSAAPSA